VERLNSVGALFEPRFRFPPAAALLHGASIFRTAKLGTQPLRAALSLQEKRGDDCRENHDESRD
jgi:hypothetical protein